VSAQQENLGAAEFFRIPPHAGVLHPAEQVPGGALEEKLLGERQSAARAGRFRAEAINGLVARVEHGFQIEI